MKLIDILVMISKGELKEGEKVEWDGVEYTYYKRNGHDEIYSEEYGAYLWNDMYWGDLNEEAKLIEPDHFADDGKMAEKIKELDISEMEIENFYDVEFIFTDIACKLNEVIRRINNVR